MKISNTPKTPYYAVIFTSITNNHQDYEVIAIRMVELVKQQPGFLGFESAKEELGITVSYWEDEQSILNWRNNIEHQEAQRLGIEKFYKSYTIRICKVERTYSFEKK